MEKITKDHSLSGSQDILAENIQKLKEIFPEVFSEGRVDFEKLQLLLGDLITPNDELYGLNWWGKNEAIKESMKRSLGTLRPDKESSKNWEKTENIYIEGDNLEVLKLLQKSYNGKIKMIYIDPPYNTGKDFVYKDNYKDNLKNYLEQTDQVDSEGVKQSTNTKEDGRYHSNWLNMMYPRLRLSRNLLKDDGVILISIDDNEVDNLKKLCDEIFGETNFISNLIWQKKTGASDSSTISTITESIIVYCKDINFIENTFSRNFESFDLTRYRNKDEHFELRGPYYTDNLDRGGLQYSDSLNFGIECPDGTLSFPNGRKEFQNDGWIWKWSKSKVQWARENNFIEFKKSDNKNSGWSVYYKNYLNVDNENNQIVRSAPHKNLITSILNASSSSDMKKLFDERVFQYTKPVDLIKLLIKYVNFKNNEIILDFFSGSGTTAHSVMQLNSEDELNRKHIQVQLPEITDEKSEAFKSGYKTITEIGKERIRRAGDTIFAEKKEELDQLKAKASLIQTDEEKAKIQELEEIIAKLDIGFKVFKLDSSNIEAWDTEMPETVQGIQTRLEESRNHLKKGRTEEDLLYELLLKQGLLLTSQIEERSIAGARVYSISHGELFICMNAPITMEVIEGIGNWGKESIAEAIVDLKPVLVLKDEAFGKDDAFKTNAELRLKNEFGFAKVNTL
ncbi:site-specific DNA-methyltransferase [Cyclobacterium xiamenense]|uniref:site-specific DNA-methyltransferase n=1 Tax=Cyclobacterium xiamenense TaxID=1297121 RepID=UPI0012B7981C|nr:site-specific DNA-methyltransferase [Cyclobacterium xiamenense]